MIYGRLSSANGSELLPSYPSHLQVSCPVPEILRHLPPRLRHSAGRCHWVEALCSPARVIIPAPGVLPES